MTFSRVKPGGWALYEVLTSAQMNALDVNTSRALDGYAGGTWSPSAEITINQRIVSDCSGLSGNIVGIEYSSFDGFF